MEHLLSFSSFRNRRYSCSPAYFVQLSVFLRNILTDNTWLPSSKMCSEINTRTRTHWNDQNSILWNCTFPFDPRYGVGWSMTQNCAEFLRPQPFPISGWAHFNMKHWVWKVLARRVPRSLTVLNKRNLVGMVLFLTVLVVGT